MPRRLTDEEKTSFEEQGFAVLRNIVDSDALAKLRGDYARRLDEMCAQWRSDGALADARDNMPIERRFQAIVNDVKNAVPDWIQHFNIALPSGGVTEESPIHLSRPVFDFLSQGDFLDAAEELIGPEISLHPVGLVRIKLPEADVPPEQRSGLTARAVWHQDRGIGLEEFNRARFVTLWIPVTDATVENGCLLVIPGSHRGALIDHCPGGVTSFDAGVVQIPEALLPGAPEPVPMRAGDALLLHPLLVHSSGPNLSNGIRWSFDIRYLRTGDPSGRPEWPAVALRSRDPRRVAGFDGWRDAWLAARSRLARDNPDPLPHRWDGKLNVCG